MNVPPTGRWGCDNSLDVRTRTGDTRCPAYQNLHQDGDDGTTALGSRQRVPKDSLRVAAYGTVDELNSHIGVALATGLAERLTN